ncbi:unnamed protein product [Calypogeia fissa]
MQGEVTRYSSTSVFVGVGSVGAQPQRRDQDGRGRAGERRGEGKQAVCPEEEWLMVGSMYDGSEPKEREAEWQGYGDERFRQQKVAGAWDEYVTRLWDAQQKQS